MQYCIAWRYSPEIFSANTPISQRPPAAHPMDLLLPPTNNTMPCSNPAFRISWRVDKKHANQSHSMLSQIGGAAVRPLAFCASGNLHTNNSFEITGIKKVAKLPTQIFVEQLVGIFLRFSQHFKGPLLMYLYKKKTQKIVKHKPRWENQRLDSNLDSVTSFSTPN